MMLAVYLKATRLATVSSTIGEIVTMQSNDAYRVTEGIRWFLFLPLVVVNIAGTFYINSHNVLILKSL